VQRHNAPHPVPPRRHLASSGVDVYSAVGGGVGALYGPLHGGANEAVLRMLERIGSTDNIPGFIEGVKNRKEKLFGFGHRCAAAACAALVAGAFTEAVAVLFCTRTSCRWDVMH
jgi:Citrate synthase, C-terminal domain